MTSHADDPTPSGAAATLRARAEHLASRGLATTTGNRLRTARAHHRDRVLRSSLRSRRRSAVLVDAYSRLLIGRTAGRAEQRDLRPRLKDAGAIHVIVDRLLEAADGHPQQVRLAARLGAHVMQSQWDGPTSPGTPTLVFLHTMKVGGVSLTDSLVRSVGPGQALPHLYIDELVALPVSLLRGARVITGHLPYEALDVLPGPFRTATALRDPVTRTLSHYRHLRALAPTLPGIPDDLTLDRFLRDPQFDVVSGNYQARQLAHKMDLAGAWIRYSPPQRYAAVGGDPTQPYPLQSLFDSTPSTLTDDELLDTATKHLDTVDHVGTTEQLGPFSELLVGLVSSSAEAELQTLNVSPRAPDDSLDAGLRKLIDQRTQVDRVLYEQALERQREWLTGT